MWTDEAYIEAREDLRVFSKHAKNRTVDQLRTGSMACAVTLMYFDAMSTQDSVAGQLIRRGQRHRLFMQGFRVFRIEISEAILSETENFNLFGKL